MGRAEGGRWLAERLERLRTDLDEYFGAINQRKAGIKIKMPAKPQALVRYEQTIKLGIPLRTGGIYNQPYVFMLEWAICDQMKTIFDAVESATSG